ncbi:translation initiation factor eIF3 subunit [Exophiala xenobiotica]|nr:translation initiation factor eIF3 subunit [Exophiala xenobiotica]
MTVEAHEYDTTINDLQFSPDRTYFITARKDKSAKQFEDIMLPTLPSIRPPSPRRKILSFWEVVKRQWTLRRLRRVKVNSGLASITRSSKTEIGRVRGHFGPLNTIAVHPQGIAYSSGGEDGYVRMHNFDKAYFDFMYEVEREQARK